MTAHRVMRGLLPVLITSALIVGCGDGAASRSNAQASTSTSPDASFVSTPVPSLTPAATPPRTSSASWPSDKANASDIVAKFRSAGLQVESQPPPSTVVFGADRVDMFLVRGETAAIYTFATPAASGRVLDEAARGRLTVSYLRTPYFVQAANLLVVITSDDPTAVRTLIAAINRS